MSRAPGEYSGLTAMQAELLSFLRYRNADGQTPSFEEMKEALGLASKSGVHRLMRGLEERGYVKRPSHRARDITVFDTRHGTPSVATASLEQLLAEIGRRGLRVSLVI
jgi:repressor LexA